MSAGVSLLISQSSENKVTFSVCCAVTNRKMKGVYPTTRIEIGHHEERHQIHCNMETREVAVKSQKLVFLGHIIRAIFSKIGPEPVAPEESYIAAFANIILLYKAKTILLMIYRLLYLVADVPSGCRIHPYLPRNNDHLRRNISKTKELVVDCNTLNIDVASYF